MRLLTFALVVAAAAADDSKNETLDEGYSLAGLQLNLSTCDLFIVALAMAENSPLIDSFEAGPAETLRQEPHLARCAVGADSPLTGPGPGHLAASPMLVAGTTPVFTAIMAGQADWLAAILDAGGDPNARRSDDLEALEFPLLYAAAYGRVREAQLLIDAGADLDAANAMGHTPLIAATMHGHEDAVRTLLAAGADCNIATTPQGGTPAIYAAGALGDVYYEILTVLAASGRCDLDQVDANRWSPSEWAAKSDASGRALDILATHGADLNQADKWGRTVAHQAASFDHPKVIETLHRHGADLTKVVPFTMPGEGGAAPHHVAIVKQSVRALKALIAAGVDVCAMPPDNGPDGPGDFLLQAKAHGGNTVYRCVVHGLGPHPAISHYREPTTPGPLLASLRVLIEDARCDVDATTTMKGKFVWQPVFAAIETNRPDALRILAAAGADIVTIADKKAYSGGDPSRPPPSLADFAEVVSPASAAVLREYGRIATHRGGSYTEDPHPDYAEEYAEL